MKPARFHYRRVDSQAELVALLAEHGPDAQIIAGGQSLMPMLNMRLARPAVLIDINPIAAFTGETATSEGIELGALTRHRDLADRTIGAAIPLLARAAAHIAHPAIRHRGTIGGSVALADPAAEWPAVCLCLAAAIKLVSHAGPRWCPAADFFRGLLQTAAAPDEAIAAIRFPPTDPSHHFAFRETARRHGDYAVAGAAARARTADGTLRDLRLVLFGISDRPSLAPATARLLEENPATSLDDLKRAIAAEIEIIGSLAEPAPHRLHLAAVQASRIAADLLAAR